MVLKALKQAENADDVCRSFTQAKLDGASTLLDDSLVEVERMVVGDFAWPFADLSAVKKDTIERAKQVQKFLNVCKALG